MTDALPDNGAKGEPFDFESTLERADQALYEAKKGDGLTVAENGQVEQSGAVAM